MTYLKTPEGWLYLAIVMDLYSRRIVGWHMSSQIDTALISKALMMAYNLRSPSKGCVFHSDRAVIIPALSIVNGYGAIK
ncbi:DDE-type integrase/transposase/recombinase [Providencia stuartii]|uniref:DDE-type integrase/transposase/recombinase n=1 Tax=Providencia stuartii TaxID=588 RepID=UPI00234A4C74|nr:DDE-type integrase/transposase/recombinase [Providencia sp. PROV121]